MAERLDHARILIYSHDSFGLGHLRRCRSIAHSLVARFKGVSVLILSGSPIIGSFDFKARVDFVRIPGVIKLRGGEYTSLGLHIDLEQTLSMRESIIYHTAASFKPDIFIVDKEPTGLQGEVVSTLKMLRDRGTVNVLGLRDVMDEASALKAEWERKDVLPVLEALYHEIWIYGLRQMNNPVASVGLSQSVQNKITFTGYLDRELPGDTHWVPPVSLDDPFILVTVGGGGDGVEIVDWVIDAYENDPGIPQRAIVVTGPFMPPVHQQQFQERCAKLDKVDIISFDSHIELLMERSSAIVAMGGYNTFCEILSLDKPALIVPRSTPRLEQLIRATRAVELGLASMLDPEGERDPAVMAAALHRLPDQKPPSAHKIPGLLDGHEHIAELIRQRLEEPYIDGSLTA
ncbi:MAG: glycosyltransferase [Gammaproteobacteria bacterium]|nr:glycosyltransferase [Gammaproteobacteria bacterium]